MKREIKWFRPKKYRGTRLERVSKCGRFQVITYSMASGRPGYFNARAYEALVDGRRIGRELHDTLEMALDACETENNPNWEPDT